MTDKILPEDSDKLKIIKGIEQPSHINKPAIGRKTKKVLNESEADEFVEGIVNQDITYLSRAITLVESNRPEHGEKAARIVQRCLPLSGKSTRIGITGIPGVGKSTFIEAFGTWLIEKQDRKVAVMAVDPSSSVTKGSILGDKTRMSELSSSKKAFIRPSPSGGSLGGVARKTRETMILCEAAGYDTILVETVGVGQSETTVRSMVDFFLLLMLAGAGDELQGIKRGIIELADMIVINKADDLPEEKIRLARNIYRNALHLYPPANSGWIPEVSSCSSVTKEGISSVWSVIDRYFEFTIRTGYFLRNRQEQAKGWLYETINQELTRSFFGNKFIQNKLKNFEKEVIAEKISPFEAARELLGMTGNEK